MAKDEVTKFEAPLPEDDGNHHYQAVVIIGPEINDDITFTDENDDSKIIAQRKAVDHINSEYEKLYGAGNYLILGDGENPIKPEQLHSALDGKLGPHTLVQTFAHGENDTYIDSKGNTVFSKHKVDLFEEPTETQQVLKELKDAFDKDPDNAGEELDVQYWSCYSGAAANDVPRGVNVAFHSSANDTASYQAGLINIIETAKYHKQPLTQSKILPECTNFENVLAESITSNPEPLVYSRRGEVCTIETNLEEEAETSIQNNLAKLEKFINPNAPARNYKIPEINLTTFKEIAENEKSESRKKSKEESRQKVEECKKTIDETTLAIAIASGNVGLITACSEQGFEVTPEILSKSLSHAIFTGDKQAVERCLDKGASVDDPDQNGIPPLHNSASSTRCSPEITQLLLERGAKTGQLDKHGNTTLSFVNGKTGTNCITEKINLIIQAGEDVNATDKFGYTALQNSLFKEPSPEKNEILNSLIKNKAKIDHESMILVTSSLDADATDILISHGGNINEVDQYGYTLTQNTLINTTSTTGEEIPQETTNKKLQFLLERGANPNQESGEFKTTPIETAAINNNPGATKLLMAYGAPPPPANLITDKPEIKDVVDSFKELEGTIDKKLRKSSTEESKVQRRNAREEKIKNLSDNGKSALKEIIGSLADTATHRKPEDRQTAVEGLMRNLTPKERKATGIAMDMEEWKNEMDNKLNGLEKMEKENIRQTVKACGHIKETNFDSLLSSPTTSRSQTQQKEHTGPARI